MDRNKVLVISNYIKHYRIPFFNELSKTYDLTVAYSMGEKPDERMCRFQIMYLPIYKIGRFILQKGNLVKLAKKYDCVVSLGEISWLKNMSLPWFGVKTVYHAIGVAASYKVHYDSKYRWDKLRDYFFSKANALAFYTEYPITKAKLNGKDTSNMFVAINTVEVHPVEKLPSDSILFIGTIYKEKGLQKLLNAYKIALEKTDMPILNIVGTGPDMDDLKTWCNENGLVNKINFTGAIYEESQKAAYFSRAYACISPDQAGLSVLESMGYGVPFITSKNAITGGESLNIENQVNGVVYEKDDELVDILIDIVQNPNKYERLGIEAQKYYSENATISHMAKGMVSAIEYAMQN